ncbi:MAG: CDP-diacylglycerol--serine O-phosphatidyltransferase [Gammaproteobacteria bacterium CG11_big_fil_rev_8_21_14_0_20_46_22]|nr:MAG: CDP-diacylglycerol--serine O-phosphatidyltransferase [Gammaproteobacteria bacterium CG12_big_fil_rev_8_21_14_0_65_46_12]PIR10819.1 MAG: CDP-diacylglycerol--serine O-phosphatidyltransferase [Gammaproteobacteria bacterium CG11_big_fil_rev_8_21_14_0_20_46_22]
MTDTPEEKNDAWRAKSIYLLPNLFTTAALFAGFYAVVAAMKGMFDVASIAIFIGMIADGFDGRVARMTGTHSAFGAQYDSLSDLVGFGVAPALVSYSWGLHYLGKLGWLCAFFYCAATALRLARFNSSTAQFDKRYFYGLPCPSAAAVIASSIWLLDFLGWHNSLLCGLLGALNIAMGLLMVSNVRYSNFKSLNLKGKVPFMVVLLMVLAFVMVALEPPGVLFIVFGAYACSGPALYFLNLTKKSKAVKPSEGDDA